MAVDRLEDEEQGDKRGKPHRGRKNGKDSNKERGAMLLERSYRYIKKGQGTSTFEGERGVQKVTRSSTEKITHQNKTNGISYYRLRVLR